MANPLSTIKDTGKAIGQAIMGKTPTGRDYLDLLGIMYTLMKELRGNARNEVEGHIDNPRSPPSSESTRRCWPTPTSRPSSATIAA